MWLGLIVYFALGLLLGDSVIRIFNKNYLIGMIHLIVCVTAVYYLYFVLGLLA